MGLTAAHRAAHPLLREARRFDALANVARALPGPDDVAKRGGRVIEGIHAQARIVGAGQEGVAGAEAGAQNAEVLVALLLEPVEAATNIDHSLAAGGNGAADVGADGVVGALKLHGTANVVIGLGEPQRRDAHAIEERAQRVVAEAVGVPLRQDDDGLLGPRGILVRRERDTSAR